MSDAIDNLIQEIAKKNGVAVSRDDPIMVLHTINESLLNDSSKAQRAILEQFREELEGVAHRWSLESKDKAERILNAALSASQNAMSETLQESASHTSQAIAKEISKTLVGLNAQNQSMKNLALFNLLAAALTFMASIILFFTFS